MRDELSAKKELLMCKMHRKQTILSLQHNIHLSLESFMNVEETISFQQAVYRELDKMSYRTEVRNDFNDTLFIVKELKKKFDEISKEEVVIFYHEMRDYGGLIVRVSDFFENVDKLAEFSGFSLGYNNEFGFISTDLAHGLYVEGGEYNNRIFFG